MSGNISEDAFKELIKTATSTSHYFRTGEYEDDGLWYYGMLAREIVFNEDLTANYVHDYEYDAANAKATLKVTLSGDEKWDFNFTGGEVIDENGEATDAWWLINEITKLRPEFLTPDMSVFNDLQNHLES